LKLLQAIRRRVKALKDAKSKNQSSSSESVSVDSPTDDLPLKKQVLAMKVVQNMRRSLAIDMLKREDDGDDGDDGDVEIPVARAYSPKSRNIRATSFIDPEKNVRGSTSEDVVLSFESVYERHGVIDASEAAVLLGSSSTLFEQEQQLLQLQLKSRSNTSSPSQDDSQCDDDGDDCDGEIDDSNEPPLTLAVVNNDNFEFNEIYMRPNTTSFTSLSQWQEHAVAGGEQEQEMMMTSREVLKAYHDHLREEMPHGVKWAKL